MKWDDCIFAACFTNWMWRTRARGQSVSQIWAGRPGHFLLTRTVWPAPLSPWHGESEPSPCVHILIAVRRETHFSYVLVFFLHLKFLGIGLPLLLSPMQIASFYHEGYKETGMVILESANRWVLRSLDPQCPADADWATAFITRLCQVRHVSRWVCVRGTTASQATRDLSLVPMLKGDLFPLLCHCPPPHSILCPCLFPFWINKLMFRNWFGFSWV